MKIPRQTVLIGLLFLGLILIAAGIGAMAAGESGIGGGLLIGGVVLAIADAVLVIIARRS
jgi:hypothetical protein